MKSVYLLLLSYLFFSSCSIVIPTLIPFQDIPEPSGSFRIGTRVSNWEDVEREEWFTDKEGDLRKIVIQVWYPSDTVSGNPVPYLDNAQHRLVPISEQIGLPPFLIRHIKDVQSNSYANSPLKISDELYPLVIFSHGLGGMRMQNTIQMEELASHGYVVLAVDHPYDANVTLFADGHTADYRAKMRSQVKKEDFWSVRLPQINTRIADLIFILDQIEKIQNTGDTFWKQVDLTRVGVMGHSFGGGTAIGASIKDDRFNVCIALDGWLEPIEESLINEGMDNPFLYIGRSEWDQPLNYENLEKLITNSSAPAEKLLLEGTQHFDYADIPHFTSVSSKIGLSGSIPSSELLDTMNTRIISFFGEYLQKD